MFCFSRILVTAGVRKCSPSRLIDEGRRGTVRENVISSDLRAQSKPFLNNAGAEHGHQYRIPPNAIRLRHRGQLVEQGDDILLIVKRERREDGTAQCVLHHLMEPFRRNRGHRGGEERMLLPTVHSLGD